MEEVNVSSQIGYSAPFVAKTATPAARANDPEARYGDAVLADQRAAVELSLALLWKELALGLCSVVDAFFTDERCFLVTSPVEGQATPLEGRRLQIVEAVLAGEGQKSIAIELKLAPSTVALNARLALTALGLSAKPSRAHPLLMLAARASRIPSLRAVGRLSFIERGGSVQRVVSIARPDLGLHRVVPPAELAVIRLLIEGAPYEEIALHRGTATRTVANQVTAVFRRLKVSGRNELLLLLLASSAEGRSATGAFYETLVPAADGVRLSG